MIEAIGVVVREGIIEKEVAVERAVRHERNPINQIGASLKNGGAGRWPVVNHLEMAIGQYDRRGDDLRWHNPQSDGGGIVFDFPGRTKGQGRQLRRGKLSSVRGIANDFETAPIGRDESSFAAGFDEANKHLMNLVQ